MSWAVTAWPPVGGLGGLRATSFTISTVKTFTSADMDTHTDRDSYTHITHRDPRTASTYSNTHTHTETHIHTDIDTHTETHTLPQHTEHLTDNSHSDFLRDEKCFRATRRLVFGGPENFKKILKNNTVRFKFLSFLIFSEPPKI